MRISIVLPAYNEAGRLRKAVEKVEEYAKTFGYDYEIIIAEDGSTDGTDLIAKKIAEENPRVKHLHSPQRLGRGKALMNAFKNCSGDILVYMDVDLSTRLEHLEELVNAIRDGYDIATGSRLMKESKAKRPLKRDVASRVYNFLVRFLLRSSIHDHQCGFKAFRRDAIMKIGENVKDLHWFWDTEVLVLAQRMGYRVKEIPVIWEHGGDTKVRFKKDVLYMFSQVMRMFLEDLSRSRKFFFIATMIAIAILVILAFSTGLSNFYHSISMIKVEFVFFSCLLYASSFLLRGYRFKYIISKLGENSSLKNSTFAVSIGQTVNVITPIRLGDVARAYVFKKTNVSYTTSLGGIAVERVFDILSITLIAFLACFYLGYSAKEPFYAIIFAFLAILAIIALSRMPNFLGKIMQKAKIVLNFRDSTAIFILSSLLWLSDVIVCFLLSISFGISFVVVALAVAMGNIVKAIPITPGGIGTYELTLTAIFSLYTSPAAFAIAFADHALKNLVTIILGVFSLSAMNLSLREVKI